jgi:hypothetical protein
MRTRHSRPADRRGFALAVALFALVVIGALIAGVFFASTQEYRVGRNTLTQQRAFAIAELGLNRAFNSWSANSARYRALAVGGIATADTTVDGGVARVKVTRLNATSFWVVSEGTAGGDAMTEARRKTSGVMRFQMPSINFLGALTLRGQARIGGSSQINGGDQNPTGWGATCPTASGGMPGVVVDSLNHISYSGNTYSVSGVPSGVVANPMARDTSTYFHYGDMEWADLVRSATVPVPAGANYSRIWHDTSVTVVNGVSTRRCITSTVTNWGQVTRTSPAAGICEDYFPIIYAAGDLSIQGGAGQGILLVAGDLSVQGGFEFYGPVIVRGTLRTSGTGGHFNGGVMAANIELDANTVLGDAIVNYSSCAINQALMGSASPQWVDHRAWSELF